MEGLPIHHDIEQEASGLIGCVSLAAELGASVEVIPVSEIKPIIIELLMRNGMTPTIGQQIKSARLKAGLTQKALAERLGISQSHIAAIEAGRENLTVASLEKVAKALGKELVIRLK